MTPTQPNRIRAIAIALVILLSTTAILTLSPGALAAGPIELGPPEVNLAGLPAYVANTGGPPCYPEILAADLPNPLAPLRFPDNVPEEFAYYDLGTAGRLPVLGGGTVRFRETLQGFGLDTRDPIIRNFVRLEVDGVPPGTYGVLEDPQGTLQGTTFVVAGARVRIETMIISPADVTDGPVRDLSIRTGFLTLARDGFVVARVPVDAFAGCAPTPVVGAPPVLVPTAAGGIVCGFLTCAFDGSRSFPSAGATISTIVWDFGDGGFSNTMNTIHTYAAAGSYVVTLTIVDSSAASASFVQTITVFTGGAPPPLPVSFVTFQGVRTNNFLGVIVGPADQVLAVAVSVNGGPLRGMDASPNVGEWRMDAVPRNVVVQFTATLIDGRTVSSARFLWPSFEPA